MKKQLFLFLLIVLSSAAQAERKVFYTVPDETGAVTKLIINTQQIRVVYKDDRRLLTAPVKVGDFEYIYTVSGCGNKHGAVMVESVRTLEVLSVREWDVTDTNLVYAAVRTICQGQKP
jgi:hypothetical protein